MKKLGNNGFSLVEGLLITVIVIMISGVGYYVYTQNQSVTKSQSSSSTQTTSQTTKTEPVQEETKLIEFVSEEHGFRFAYPDGWDGSYETEIRPSSDKGKAGKAYDICIGFCDKLSIGFVTRDWVPAEQFLAKGFTEYENCEVTSDNITKSVKIFEDDTTCLVVNGGEAYNEPAAYIFGQKKFSDASPYAGIQIEQAPVAVDELSDDSLKNAYVGNEYLLELLRSFEEI